MFYADKRLQFPVRVEKPNPLFARALQQALGGVEGEIRVMMQYMFQAWGSRGPTKYRDMLQNTAAEEIGHCEMLATAIALNLEGAPLSIQEEVASDAMAGSVLGGMNLRHILSTGLAATPENSNGVPFNASHVYASGNIAADMLCNACAEATGRVLATRLWNMTDDPGMKQMLGFMIARDTMHQQQWLAVVEELGGHEGNLPIPNSFPQENEDKRFSYAYFVHDISKAVPEGRWTEGASLDGKGAFSAMISEPLGDVPQLAPARPDGGAQVAQSAGASAALHAGRGTNGHAAARAGGHD